MDRSHPFSKSIEILRVIGTLLVVLLHSQQDNLRLDGSLNSIVQISLSNVICTVAVPLFFFISGYLFSEGFSVDKSFSDNFSVYKRKIKSRFRSLVIPYFLWNLLVLIAFSLMFYFIKKEPIDFFLKEQGVYGVLWSYHGFPIDYSLWFVRDLIILSLFFPLHFFIIKYSGVIGLISFFVLLLFGIKIPVDGLNTTSLFFFYFGAFMSIKYSWRGEMQKGVSLLLMTISIVFAILSVVFFNDDRMSKPIIKLFDTISIILLLSLFSKLFESKPLGGVFSYSQLTFFIIAFHPIVLFCVKQSLELFLPALNPLYTYFLVFCITLVTSLSSYILLVKLTPRLIDCLTGRRARVIQGVH